MKFLPPSTFEEQCIMVRYAYAVARRKAGKSDAEYMSAANEAMVKALKTYTGEAPFLQYMAVFVRRAVGDVMRVERRRAGRHAPMEAAANKPCPTIVPTVEELLGRLDLDVELGKKHWVEGHTVPEIAADMGIAASTVYKRLTAIRKRLFDIYEDT
jgi:DNA-directed RNA polymerase specialized sigma24 family protein